MAYYLNKSLYFILCILILIIDISLASLHLIVKDISPYNVIGNTTTYTYTECRLLCDEYEGCREIFVNETDGVDLLQCLFLSNKTIKECVKPRDINIALNKPSKMIGVRNVNQNFAHEINDGKYTTFGAASNGDGAKFPWWQVDLERIVSIKLIKLYLKKYEMDNNLYQELRINTRLTKTETAEECVTFKPSKDLIQQVTCDKNTQAQYITVILQQLNAHLALNEVEIFEWT